MKQEETLKCYIGYFQSQVALVYNCSDNVIVVAFIAGLQISDSSYKHLVKNDVTKIKDILSRARSMYNWKKQQGIQQTTPPDMKLRFHTRLKDITGGMMPIS